MSVASSKPKLTIGEVFLEFKQRFLIFRSSDRSAEA